MAQYPNARVSFGTILCAIENQLVNDGVVPTAGNISWGTPDQIPQFSGPSDVLLVARDAMHEPRDGGAGQFSLRRVVDVFYRAEAIPDAGGGYKSWISAAFAAGDAILDSIAVDGFWPEDDAGNLLTIEPIYCVGDQAPTYPRSGAVFGNYVCTLSVLYFPATDPTKGVFPLP